MVAIFPAADGDVDQFAPSTGLVHYTCVDENPANDYADFVSSINGGNRELWQYGSLGTLSTIAGLQVNTDCAAGEFGSSGFRTLLKSGGTEYPDAEQNVGSTFITKRRVCETDPATGLAWTPSSINNAQFGVRNY